FQVCAPLAQTICPGSTRQSFGKASPLATQSAKRFRLPLPLGEGWGEGAESRSGTDALSLTVSQREREFPTDSRVNQSASDDSSGHTCALGVFGGLGFDGRTERRSSVRPCSASPGREVIWPDG